MYDIIYISNNDTITDNVFLKIKTRFPLVKYAKSIHDAQKKSFTKMFWAIFPDIDVLDTFMFEYKVPQWDEQYVHVFKNDDTYDGVCLIPKTKYISTKEIEYRFFADNKEIDIQASTHRIYDKFYIDTYEEYLTALENTTTELFWVIPRDIQVVDEFNFDLYFSYNNLYDREQNHVFKHYENNEYTYDGIFLCSTHTPLSKKEIDFRFPVNRKEWDIVASTYRLYDKFYIDTYEEYLNALENTTTELFWVIPRDIQVVDEFNFDLYFSKKKHEYNYDREQNHVFLNGDSFDGIMLLSSNNKLSKKEFNVRFPINKKEWFVVASKPKMYDIVFISYNEMNASENYQKLLDKFNNVYRVDGITGIHQAHIEAAKQVTTNMFWVIDADAILENDFNLDYHIPTYDINATKSVHVWRSRNPVNGLEYGYGGVKLLPTKLTLGMDITNPDMTTSISESFIPVDIVANITSFNTDPFSTWKSAFRECVKLSSKIIIGQNDTETENRLKIWCTIGEDKPFGTYALDGAKFGREYGQKNAGNIPALYKINDFKWLQDQFNSFYQI